MSNVQTKKKRQNSQYVTERYSKNNNKGQSDKSPQCVNVNSYKHFLQVPSINGDYIQWAFGLRSHKGSKTFKSLTQAPNVYYKTIEAQKQKHSTADISPNVNMSQFQHLGLHRIGTHPAASLLKFQTGLRSDKSNQQQLQRQKKWNNYAKKDRKQTPRLINSKSLKKKIVSVEQTVSAFDGRHKYPKFTQKIIAVRNYNQFRHMLKGQINLPSIGWQTNLRQY